MTYKVVSDFIDFLGDGQAYKSGDTYPHSGTADPNRVAHLMTPTTQRGSLLEIVEEVATGTNTEKHVATRKKRKKE